MTLVLKQVFNFIKLLNSETGANQIAAGIACGLVLGFSPAFSLQTLLIFFIIFFFRVQMGAAFLAGGFFAVFSFLLNPVFHWVGSSVLEIEGLRPLYTALYNMPIVPFTRFNNSIVMGGGVVAIVLSPLVFAGSKRLVLSYREKILTRIEATTWWKAMKANTVYQWYKKYEALHGE